MRAASRNSTVVAVVAVVGRLRAASRNPTATTVVAVVGRIRIALGMCTTRRGTG